ncbi:MAG: gephyrin-like molybdotransferase Glp [Pseudomonadota bacterium]|nr:gephyrin-like molybdotransferase Glp [Pseudomonadota bacterium]
MASLLPVADALARVTAAFEPLPAEQVSLADALGRVLAEDVSARLTQPPTAVSAMDGYAVRTADVATAPVTLRRVGEAPAGGAHDGVLGPGETVRIYTGGPVPDGADAIIMQEDTAVDGDQVTMNLAATQGKFIRPAGLDFATGDIGLTAGRRLAPRDIGLAAAMNVPWLAVRHRPRVALLATGDEVVRPGEPVGPNQIVSSNTLALAALVSAAGGEPVDLGIALDNAESLERMAAGAKGADVLVTTGGASVGDHDLVRKVLGKVGFELDFWRIAMRPGKPLIFGLINGTPLLGVPGNPVSALVCGMIFLRPAMDTMLAVADHGGRETAVLGRDLDANDERQDYLRARLEADARGDLVATPFSKQDSSMLLTLASSACLVVRAPHAGPVKAGERVEILRL